MFSRRMSVAAVVLGCWSAWGAEYKPIPRVLPPTGIEIPDEQVRRLRTEVQAIRTKLHGTGATAAEAADVAVFLKAVDFALDFGEFYGPKDVDKAGLLLKNARERVEHLTRKKTPWSTARGLVVRGFESKIDGSVQPYGLVIPDEVLPEDKETFVPLYIFLHGRGDKQTDLHFIEERLRSKGQVTPPGAIVLHPFGRQCVGFKSAGEADVLEALAHVLENYPIDADRIVLMGFSMGGAGAWHLGAHYADIWTAVAPGAGFAETARYTKTKPEDVPAYERKLWACYDVPCSVRNLFNVKTIAYSGELDKQIQAARVMEEAFQAEGRTLDHRIGPGVEHKYEPRTLEKLLADLADHVRAPGESRDRVTEYYWQAQTLRYAAEPAGPVQVLGLDEHWSDARFTRGADGSITTKNIRAFQFLAGPTGNELAVDGKSVDVSGNQEDRLTLVKGPKGWAVGTFPPPGSLQKIPGLQGPIDDAFQEPFLVVTPSGKSKHAGFQRWMEFELAHFRDRWRGVMRGDVRIKADKEVTASDLNEYHVIVWGDPDSNSLLKRMQGKLPVRFEDQVFLIAGKTTYDRNAFAPALIYPNPLNPEKYVVLNSGLTFREAQDKTNSQQNPKLPDWAVIDLSEPPSASAPGKIAGAGFFDEQWRIK